MANTFKSIYADPIARFIAMKRNLGFKYNSGESYMKTIDNYAIIMKQSSPGITKEFANEWCTKRPNESLLHRYARVSKLIDLSVFMNNIGIESYIPKLPVHKTSNFIPYIYTVSEINSLFKAADEIVLSDNMQMNTCIFSMPLLFRLLYSTGLRISEALNLMFDDINVEERFVKVNDSKTGRQRLIPISDSLNECIKTYIFYYNKLPFTKNRNTYFFVMPNGKKIGDGSVRNWYYKCIEGSNIIDLQYVKRPRIHDLRHTFAVTALANMADSGLDLYVSLPILSTYLGHQNIQSTDQYIRLTIARFPHLINKLETTNIDVFPKFRDYESK